MDELILKIITPEKSLEAVKCESIRLPVCDNEKGKGAGSYGIRKGHIESLLAVEAGEVKAFSGSELVFSGKCAEGFANVKNNIVTVVVDCFMQ